jgi:Cu2+-exporting ATPase
LAWWLHHDPSRALATTVAVLVISCPCALALATPVALTAATGALARRQFLIARGHALPTLAQVTHVMFDKTGTLTVGKPRVVGATLLVTDDEAKRLVRSLESHSEHVLARALLDHVGEGPVEPVTQLHHERGQGIEGVIDGVRHRIGKAAYVAALVGTHCPDEQLMWLGRPGQWLAGFAVADGLRDDAIETIRTLRRSGLSVLIASGDRVTTVNALAATLGVDEAHGDLLPADKLAWLTTLQDEGAVVWMIGDGVNDAPVLAGAALSAAMGQGADVARQTADIVLLGEQLAPLADGYALARKTRRVVIENLCWATAYNLVAFPLAACGLVTPLLAGVGMASSSLLVVLNALRLAQAQPHK